MPYRGEPQDLGKVITALTDRVSLLENHRHTDIVGQSAEDTKQTLLAAYLWQSEDLLATGFGDKFFAERDGTIAFIRADRPAADGTTQANFDVLREGVSMFATATKPFVAAGEDLGPEVVPTIRDIKKGQSFQVNVVDTGGGTGPFHVLIQFKY